MEIENIYPFVYNNIIFRVEYIGADYITTTFPVKFESKSEAIMIADRLLDSQDITAVRIKEIVKSITNWKTK